MGELIESSNKAKRKKRITSVFIALIAILIAGYVAWWAFGDDNGTAKLVNQVQVPASYQVFSETHNRGNFCVPYDVNLCQNTNKSFENVPSSMNEEQFKELLSLSPDVKFENVKCGSYGTYKKQSCSAEVVKKDISMTLWYDPSGNKPMLYIVAGKKIT